MRADSRTDVPVRKKMLCRVSNLCGRDARATSSIAFDPDLNKPFESFADLRLAAGPLAL
jgi:hypothetical protein